MDRETSLASNHSSLTTEETTANTTIGGRDDTHSAFGWDVEDANGNLFTPENLPLPRPLRGYERQPRSPFAKRKVRFGKIYKRSVASANTAIGGSNGLSVRRADARPENTASPQSSPMKAVKKLRVGGDAGHTPRVSSWDFRDSPVRKIRTRSSMQGDELVALPDRLEDDHACSTARSVVVTDEDGNTVEHIDEGADEWEDIDGDQEPWTEMALIPTNSATHDILDDSSKTKVTVIEHPVCPAAAEPDSALARVSEVSNTTHVEARTDERSEPTTDIAQQPRTACESVVQQEHGSPPKVPDVIFPIPAVGRAGLLAAGFISPVRRKRTIKERMASLATSGRRKTLPLEFAPKASAEPSKDQVQEEPRAQEPGNTVIPDAEAQIEGATSEANTMKNAHEEKLPLRCSGRSEASCAEVETTNEAVCMLSTETDDGNGDTDESGNHGADLESLDDHYSATEITLSTREDSVPGIGVYESDPSQDQLHIPVRHLSRRRSSSPIKRSMKSPIKMRPHYVALSPIKRMGQTAQEVYIEPSDDTDVDTPSGITSESHPIGRSASASPEEPHHDSPKRLAKPRISDDTALLQAFLNRAAEQKFRSESSGPKTSAAKRESMENRRDSGTIREALASSQVSPPEQTIAEGILVDRDVNSPSPKKLSPTAGGAEGSDMKAAFKSSAQPAPAIAQMRSTEHDQKPNTTRRSARDKKGPPVNAQGLQRTAAGPNKIAVRSVADPIVIKRTEAQEVAVLTRHNTRKNKFGAVLPLHRMMKLAAEERPCENDGVENAVVQEVELRESRVKWREILVEYSEPPNEPGSELLELSQNGTTVLQNSGSIVDETKGNEQSHGKDPLPRDTPSKPKIRRLKPPRATASSGTVQDDELLSFIEDESVQSQAQTTHNTARNATGAKKRTRIATPAKKQLELVTTSVQPPDNGEVHQSASAGQALKSEIPVAPSNRKASMSRLPGPAVSKTGQAKDSQPSAPGLASPPKKKSATAASVFTLQTSKTPLPKLEFGNKAQLQFTHELDASAIPGIASPAKKGGSRRIFAETENSEAVKDGADERPGLSSPAKKRSTRRFVG